MTPPQSRTDKIYMRGKDILLFILGSGAIITLVHIWELPKRVDGLADKLLSTDAYAAALNTRIALVENNMTNQTSILNEIKSTQSKMWEVIGQNRRLYGTDHRETAG